MEFVTCTDVPESLVNNNDGTLMLLHELVLYTV